MITAHEVESRAYGHDSLSMMSSVHLPMFGCDVSVMVFLDPGRTTVSDRQLDCLNRILAVGPERQHEIKVQLFNHWGEYDHFYTDEKSFEYDSPDEAYAASHLGTLFLDSADSEHANYPVLGFSVEWDPEHGAHVRFFQNQFEWCEFP